VKKIELRESKTLLQVREIKEKRKLTGQELSSLAARMTETDDAAETAIIRESIARGFYGRQL